MFSKLRLPTGWVARSGARSSMQFFVCLVRGHRWDPAPQRGVAALRCVRCGMTAEPVTGP